MIDDTPLYRRGLSDVLRREPDIGEVIEVAGAESASQAVSESRPQVVLVELQLPLMQSIETIRRTQIDSPRTRVVAMTMQRHGVLIGEALKMNVDGLVLKTGAYAELRAAVRAVMEGSRFVSPELGAGFEDLQRTLGEYPRSRVVELLTAREREVALRLVEGQTCRAIAKELYLSIKTVDSHRYAALRKLGLRNVPDLTRLAVAEGLSRP